MPFIVLNYWYILTTWDICLLKAIPAVIPAASAPYKNILSNFEGHFSLFLRPTDFIADSLQRLRRPNQAASNGEKVFPKTIFPKTKKMEKNSSSKIFEKLRSLCTRVNQNFLYKNFLHWLLTKNKNSLRAPTVETP